MSLTCLSLFLNFQLFREHWIFYSVDTNKIGRTCTCIENPLFVGDLLFKVTASMSKTREAVNKTFSFNCEEVRSDTFKFRMNETIIVKAEHMSANIIGSFIKCLAFSQNGNCIQLCVY